MRPVSTQRAGGVVRPVLILGGISGVDLRGRPPHGRFRRSAGEFNTTSSRVEWIDKGSVWNRFNFKGLDLGNE